MSHDTTTESDSVQQPGSDEVFCTDCGSVIKSRQNFAQNVESAKHLNKEPAAATIAQNLANEGSMNWRHSQAKVISLLYSLQYYLPRVHTGWLGKKG